MRTLRTASTSNHFSRLKASRTSLPPRKAGALIEPWLRLANLLPPLEDQPEVRAGWSRFRSRNLAGDVPHRDLQRLLGSKPSQRLEGRALESSTNATGLMERAKASGLAELVNLRPGTEKQVLPQLARQIYFVLAGLARPRRRVSLTWVRVVYEIRAKRPRPAVRAWNPFTRFTEALEAIETSRLRRCAVCNQFFYAIRRDARCCSRKCSHTRRQHVSSGNWERYRRARAFRNQTGLVAVKGKERRRVMELSEALRNKEEEQ
jgi:hypothetical protein